MTSIPEEKLQDDEFSPLVTIIIPVFNGAAFLRGAIESALGQTYPKIEVIVVNDGSHDDGATEHIALSFGDRIRYLSKENGGVSSVLNFAILKMTGDYFSWLSHDDLYMPGKVSQQIKLLGKHENGRTIVYSDYSIFTDDAMNDDVSVFMPGVPPHHFRYWLTSRSALHGCSLLIPRTVFADVGNFDEGLLATQDYDLWFRAAKHYSFIHLPEVLVRARSHEGQDTHRKFKAAFKESSNLHLSFVKELSCSDVPGNSSGEIGRNYLTLASRLWKRGFKEAGSHSAGIAKLCGVSSTRVLVVALQARFVFWVRQSVVRFLSSETKQKIRYLFSLVRGIQRGFKIS